VSEVSKVFNALSTSRQYFAKKVFSAVSWKCWNF